MFKKSKRQTYEYKLEILGMRCGMCETHINNIIRQNFNVKKVKSNHKKNETIISCFEKLDEEKIKDIISSSGYDFKGLTIKE